MTTEKYPGRPSPSTRRNRLSREMIPAKTHKHCIRCREWLPFEAFRRNKRMKSGLSSWCNVCHLAAVQEWRERNRDEINRAWREAYGSTKPHRYPSSRASARKVS